MMGPDEALELVLENTSPKEAALLPIDEAMGCVLAEDIITDRDYPPFPRSMMDGVAVRVADAGRTVTVTGEVSAGHAPTPPVREGTCVEIMTGAPCPEGTEAIVPVEALVRDGPTATLPRIIRPGRHISPAGSDCRAGEGVLRTGERLTAVAIGVLASLGRDRVRCIPRPVLMVIPTGTELVTGTGSLPPWKLRNSNGPMLTAAARHVGVVAAGHPPVGDSMEDLLAALGDGNGADCVVLTGGVSAGKYDLVPEALQKAGARTILHKVRQKPGKPFLFARRGSQIIFGLPGNPLAAYICFHLYVEPALRRLSGLSVEEDRFRGRLAHPFPSPGGRIRFLLGRAERRGEEIWISEQNGLSVADIFHSAAANCVIPIPAGSGPLAEGNIVEGTWLGEGRWIR
jgi:molybdopterin molybdotransferase